MEKVFYKTSAYTVLHAWVRKKLGKLYECENCGTTNPDTRYDWANISGEYKKELDDWARLCHQCHSLIDGFGANTAKDYCKRGHKMSGNNISYKLMKHKHYTRYCMKCAAIYCKTYRKRLKEAKDKPDVR